ncbi:MAG: hypothetical protein IT488_12465 [Gammaproteobacteria bacterium]|nr:hypothetical protein [Gammaproteobacteria bacterium]
MTREELLRLCEEHTTIHSDSSKKNQKGILVIAAVTAILFVIFIAVPALNALLAFLVVPIGIGFYQMFWTREDDHHGNHAIHDTAKIVAAYEGMSSEFEAKDILCSIRDTGTNRDLLKKYYLHLQSKYLGLKVGGILAD